MSRFLGLMLGRNQEGQPVVANLGLESSYYYSKEMGRWVEKGKEEEARAELEARKAAPPKASGCGIPPHALSSGTAPVTKEATMIDFLCQPPSSHTLRLRTSVQPLHARPTVPTPTPPVPRTAVDVPPVLSSSSPGSSSNSSLARKAEKAAANWEQKHLLSSHSEAGMPILPPKHEQQQPPHHRPMDSSLLALNAADPAERPKEVFPAGMRQSVRQPLSPQKDNGSGEQRPPQQRRRSIDATRSKNLRVGDEEVDHHEDKHDRVTRAHHPISTYEDEDGRDLKRQQRRDVRVSPHIMDEAGKRPPAEPQQQRRRRQRQQSQRASSRQQHLEEANLRRAGRQPALDLGQSETGRTKPVGERDVMVHWTRQKLLGGSGSISRAGSRKRAAVSDKREQVYSQDAAQDCVPKGPIRDGFVPEHETRPVSSWDRPESQSSSILKCQGSESGFGLLSINNQRGLYKDPEEVHVQQPLGLQQQQQQPLLQGGSIHEGSNNIQQASPRRLPPSSSSSSYYQESPLYDHQQGYQHVSVYGAESPGISPVGAHSLSATTCQTQTVRSIAPSIFDLHGSHQPHRAPPQYQHQRQLDTQPESVSLSASSFAVTPEDAMGGMLMEVGSHHYPPPSSSSSQMLHSTIPQPEGQQHMPIHNHNSGGSAVVDSITPRGARSIIPTQAQNEKNRMAREGESLSGSSSREELFSQHDDGLSRRSTIDTHGSMDSFMDKLKEQVESRHQIEQRLHSVCQKLHGLVEERHVNLTLLNELNDLECKNQEKLTAVSESVNATVDTVQKHCAAVHLLSGHIANAEVPAVSDSSFFTGPARDVKKVLLELVTVINSLQELVALKVKEADECHQQNGECLLQIQNQANIFATTIRGHREALEEALRDKANYQVRYDQAEKVIGELLSTGKAIDESWQQWVTDHMQVLQMDFDRQLDMLKRELLEKEAMLHVERDNNERLKELNQRHHENRDATMKALNDTISGLWKRIANEEDRCGREIERNRQQRADDAARIEQLTGRVEKDSLENESLEAQLAACMADIETVKMGASRQVAKMQAEKLLAESCLAQTSIEVDELKRKVLEVEQAMQSRLELEESLKAKIANLHHISLTHQAERNEWEKESKKMKMEVESLEDARSQHHQEQLEAHRIYEAQYRMMRTEMEHMKAQFKATTDERNAFEFEIGHLKAEHKASTDERNAVDTKLRGMRAEMEHLKAQHKATTDERNGFDTELREMHAEMEHMKVQLKATTDERNAFEFEIGHLKAQHQAKTDERNAVDTKLKEMRAEIEHLKAQRNATTDEKNAFDAELKRMHVESDLRKTVQEKLEEERTELIKERDSLESDRNALKDERDVLENERNTLKAASSQQSSLDNLRDLQERHAHDRLKWTAERDMMNEEVELLTGDLHETRLQLKEATERLRAIREQQQQEMASTEAAADVGQAVNGLEEKDELPAAMMKGEILKLRTELEVAKQKDQDVRYMLFHMSDKWQALMNEFPKIARQIDARTQALGTLPQE